MRKLHIIVLLPATYSCSCTKPFLDSRLSLIFKIIKFYLQSTVFREDPTMCSLNSVPSEGSLCWQESLHCNKPPLNHILNNYIPSYRAKHFPHSLLGHLFGVFIFYPLVYPIFCLPAAPASLSTLLGASSDRLIVIWVQLGLQLTQASVISEYVSNISLKPNYCFHTIAVKILTQLCGLNKDKFIILQFQGQKSKMSLTGLKSK